MVYIYLIRNLVNNKTYVGQHNGTVNYYFGSGQNIKRAIKKYGKENFTKTILKKGNFNQLFLDELEKHYIRLYSPARTPNSYNLTDGGQGPNNWKPTDEQRAKMKARAIKRCEDPEVRKKMGDHMRGKKMLPQTAEALRKSVIGNKWNIGRKRSKESIEKMAAQFRGRTYTDQQRKNMSNGRRGMKLSEEHKRNLGLSKKGRSFGGININQYDLEGNFIQSFINMKTAARILKIDRNSIQKVVKGIRENYKNFIFKENINGK